MEDEDEDDLPDALTTDDVGFAYELVGKLHRIESIREDIRLWGFGIIVGGKALEEDDLDDEARSKIATYLDIVLRNKSLAICEELTSYGVTPRKKDVAPLRAPTGAGKDDVR
jgi:hypothetical protein